MRLEKYLTLCGLGSRREIKKLLKTKKITIDDEIITDGSMQVCANAKVFFEHKELIYNEHIYLMMYKEAGVITATKDALNKTVCDVLPEAYRRRGVVPIGRLDKDTTGLLLLTDDGGLHHLLLAPKNKVGKKYEVILKHMLTIDLIEKFAAGILLEDGYKCLPAQLFIDGPYKATLILNEGKFHQVKRMFKAVGNEVLKLHRSTIGTLELDEKIPVGSYRKLSEKELILLKGDKNQ